MSKISDEPKKATVMADFCEGMSKEYLLAMVNKVNKLPVLDDTEKMTATMTICMGMLGLLLDGVYHGKCTAEEKLQRKLEFLRITKQHWVRQAAEEMRQAKENNDDNG